MSVEITEQDLNSLLETLYQTSSEQPFEPPYNSVLMSDGLIHTFDSKGKRVSIMGPNTFSRIYEHFNKKENQ